MASLLVVWGGAGCEDSGKSGAGAASASAAAEQKVPLGGACQSNEDCVTGHGCADDKTCQTYKTIECRRSKDTCGREGLCTGDGKRCIAASDADCKEAKVCKTDGRCTAKEGTCVAVSAEDCKDLCTRLGRCTIEKGRCLAGSDDDCKQSEACKKYDKCSVKAGSCYQADR